MSKDTAERIINEQEESISLLKHKLLEIEDERDVAVDKGLEAVKALRRIECCDDLDFARRIASRAIEEYSAK